MSIDAQQYLAGFDALPAGDQREVASLILQRARHWDAEPLTDDELAQTADSLFAELDRQEAAGGP